MAWRPTGQPAVRRHEDRLALQAGAAMHLAAVFARFIPLKLQTVAKSPNRAAFIVNMGFQSVQR
ncbi:hypothetical protein GJA_456 [Janthinobacterium agaricidamnosum NBRC 102515 = DSM 9628]|uniref:Uncharacterized protein n=1 Tax=Janthinobacterium agaricidamnosum NBRC 102515 = DSM 9628 TaxID=1349767 RepID=W0UZR6_9BURK|nr:hypothetical protein GJA_456 [Janthinobacterium agaricidamnosum NBRC 102515 = DSM 9628]